MTSIILNRTPLKNLVAKLGNYSYNLMLSTP